MDASKLERAFLLPWLCSAAAVTVVRLLHAGDLGYDLTWQIQAAQHLVAGEGLTVYTPTSDDLRDPFTLEILTYFPAGYSLYAAALLAVGANAETLVKILGATATIVGWWGWAKLAFTYMSEGAGRGRAWRLAGYAIAVVSPLLFTIPWGGTDIVLWAAIPWILRLVTRAQSLRAQANLRLDVLAGAITGLCVLMRYASVFLAPFAVLVIAGQFRGMTLTARRLAAFGAGLMPALAIQGYINYFLASRPPAPAGVFVSQERLSTATERAWETLTTLSGANNGVLFWLPSRIQVLWGQAQYQPLALTLAAAMLVVPALILIARRGAPFSAWCRDIRIVGAALLIAVPLFLWASGIFGEFPLVHVPRYYWPLRPLAICIAFFLATMQAAEHRTRLGVLLTAASRAYVIAFLLMAAAAVGLLFLPTEHGEFRRRELLGTAQIRPWPSFGLNYEFSSARNLALTIMKAQPDAILITNVEHWFSADPEMDHSRMQRWEPCARLRATHVSGPARVIVLARDHGGPPEELQWSGPHRLQRVDCLERLPALRLIQRFPDEQLKVMEARIPQGVRVELKPDWLSSGASSLPLH
jgi:hypothetical protein